MMKFRLAYIVLLAGLVLSSCSDVLSSVEMDPEKEDRIVFSASNAMMITKSGLEYEDFEVGTKYLLYGVEAADPYDWTNAAVMNKTQSYETDKHLIYYGKDLHFRDKTYDFYGATICSTGEDYPIDNSAAGSAPAISLSLTDNKLDDLMYSNNLKNCTRTSGLLQMNFIHALSKIQVEVSKQNESAELAGAKIHSITVQNTYSNGTLDIVGGSWNTLSDAVDRVFSQTPVTLSTSADMIQDASGADAEMLIFPNEDDSTVSLKIVYSINGGAEQSVVCDILDHDGSAFRFNQNHRYTLAVTIANDGIQIVTVLPKVYEWTDVTVDHYLGQPVYIGGLMWMDRNLGALSADYDGDWYGTIGHYFQFGRNVPYILDVEKFKEYTGDGYPYGDMVDFSKSRYFVMKYTNSLTDNEYSYTTEVSTSDTGLDNIISATELHYTRIINEVAANGYFKKHNVEWNELPSDQKTILIRRAVECIYTYDHNGDHVYGIHYVKPTDTEELIKFPNDYDTSLGDEQIRELYRFGYGSKNPNDETLDNPTNWTFKNNCGRDYWNAPNYVNDPCPKGWRLPTTEDVYTILPRQQMSWNNMAYPTYYTSSDEEICYGYFNDKQSHVCYIMKYPGTNKAYRLRIMSHLNNDGNKRYFSVSRYGITDEDRKENTTEGYRYLDKYLDGTAPNGSNKESSMWANPIETIKFPASGFLVPDDANVDASGNLTRAAHVDLRSFGQGTVLRTSNANRYDYGGTEDGFDAFNYVQYMSTTDYQLGVQNNSRRSLGDQIRCVRDVTAED